MRLHRYLLCALVILLGAYAIRTVAIAHTSFHIDEMFTWRTVQIAVFNDSLYDGVQERKIHMPLYFATLLAYPEPHGEFMVRYPSVLWGMLLIGAAMRIMTHIYRAPRFALLLGIMIAFHLFAIEHARQARMYSMSQALIAIFSYLFLRYVSRHHRQTTIWYSAHIVSMMAYLTHVANFVLLSGQALTWFRIVIQRRSKFKQALFWATLQIILLVPALVWINHTFQINEERLAWVPEPTVNYVLNGFESIVFGNALPHPILLSILIIPLLGFILRIRHILHAEYWVGLSVIPFVGLVLLSQLRSVFVARYLGVALVAYIIILILGYKALWDYCPTRFRRLARFVIGALIGIHLIILSMFTYQGYQNGYFSNNYMRQVSVYVNEHIQDGDAIVYASQTLLSAHFYDSRRFELVQDIERYHEMYIEEQQFPHDRVWVIVDNNFWQSSNLEVQEALQYEYGDTRVYFVESEPSDTSS